MYRCMSVSMFVHVDDLKRSTILHNIFGSFHVVLCPANESSDLGMRHAPCCCLIFALRLFITNSSVPKQTTKM